MASGNITFNIDVKYSCSWCVNVNPFTCAIHGKYNLEAYKQEMQAARTRKWMSDAIRLTLEQQRIEVISHNGRHKGFIIFDPATMHTGVAMSPTGRLTWAQNSQPEPLKELARSFLPSIADEIDKYYWPSRAAKTPQEVQRSVWKSLYGGSPPPVITRAQYDQLSQYLKRYGPYGVNGEHLHDPQAGYHTPYEPDYIAAADCTLPSYSKADVRATLNMRVHEAICTRECMCNNPFNEPNTGGSNMNRRAVIAAQMKRLEREMAVLDRFPEVDPFVVGDVLKFERVFGGTWDALKDSDSITKFVYVAIKTENGWYLTGSNPRTPQAMNWASLVEWLGDHVGEIVVLDEKVSLEGFVESKKNASAPQETGTVGYFAEGPEQ